MLQRTPFMTAEELGIEPDEHQALCTVLDKLERGELRHVIRDSEANDEFGDPCGFNMSVWSCGSIHCIGGWAMKIMDHDFSWPLAGELDGLFHPDIRGTWASLTIDHAIQALSNYLTYGKSDWEAVVAAS